MNMNRLMPARYRVRWGVPSTYSIMFVPLLLEQVTPITDEIKAYTG